VLEQEQTQTSSPETKGQSLSESLNNLIKALRPKQWTKNLLIIIPIIFAVKLTDMKALSATVTYAALFCLASSSVYLMNDVIDIEQDRVHPSKCKRPIASGKISIQVALGLSLVLGLISLTGSFLVRPSLALIVLLYFLLNVLYGKVLKHQVLLDVMAIAAGFVLRTTGGCFAAQVSQSGWLCLCTTFGALFLALEKRRHELAILEGQAQQHRLSLLRYSESLLNRIESVIVPTVLICYILYSFMSYHGQWMMVTVPFVFYGLVRYQLLSNEKILTGSPEDVLLKDRPIQITIVLWLLSAIGVLYGFIPQTFHALIHWLDSLSLWPI
jgi:4-hydroxybenzoate polyprenyltransferase